MGETIALIGCGAGNAALVTHLAVAGWEGIDQLYLVDPHNPARGTAFDHDEEYLLCNTSVAVNSMFPGNESHFLRWLQADTSHLPHWGMRADAIDLHSFVPRGLFMEYVGAQFNTALESATTNGVAIEHIASRAVSIERTSRTVTVTTASGQRFPADRAVTATGLQDSTATRGRRQSAGGILAAAYEHGLIERLERSRSVLILGMRQSDPPRGFRRVSEASSPFRGHVDMRHYAGNFIAQISDGRRRRQTAEKFSANGDLCILTEKRLFTLRTRIPATVWTLDVALDAHSS